MRIAPLSPRPGDPALVTVAGVQAAREVSGSLGGQPLRFSPVGEVYVALAGLDIETKPGKLAWKVGVVDAAGTRRASAGQVTVRARSFPVQRLTVPPGMADLDPETERRANDETTRLRALYDTATPERLWQGRFVKPIGVPGDGDGFGARRIINGTPRNPHSGRDFAAERGTPVVASNRGRVALVGDFFFPGRFVALDHGLGLYSLYMHLDRVDVAEGALVERGDIIGGVGSTGRATGPHLHWAMQLGRTRLDPIAVIALPLRE